MCGGTLSLGMGRIQCKFRSPVSNVISLSDWLTGPDGRRLNGPVATWATGGPIDCDVLTFLFTPVSLHPVPPIGISLLHAYPLVPSDIFNRSPFVCICCIELEVGVHCLILETFTDDTLREITPIIPNVPTNTAVTTIDYRIEGMEFSSLGCLKCLFKFQTRRRHSPS